MGLLKEGGYSLILGNLLWRCQVMWSKVKGKVFFTLTAIIITVTAYCFGYRKGGEDYVYLDHILVGKLSDKWIPYCNKNDKPAACYEMLMTGNIEHALVFYAQYHEDISPLSAFFSIAPKDDYDKAVSDLADYASQHHFQYQCLPEKETGNLEECRKIQKEIDELVKSHVK
jgi:hypothetical protein